MDLIVKMPHLAVWNGREIPCAVGRGGIVTAEAKQEGDGGTPIGRWVMREILYRSDRYSAPQSVLPTHVINENDGWCETPEDADYNLLVKHPHRTTVDRLWREDHIYDIVVPLGYNDGPIVPGKGSAIFLHLARPNFTPSAGCVVLGVEDLLEVLRTATKQSAVHIMPQP